MKSLKPFGNTARSQDRQGEKGKEDRGTEGERGRIKPETEMGRDKEDLANARPRTGYKDISKAKLLPKLHL